MVQDADPKPTHEQAAADLAKSGAPSHGQRQDMVIDEEGVIRRSANGSMISAQSGLDQGRIKVAHRIGVPRKGLELEAAAGQGETIGNRRPIQEVASDTRRPTR